jgi:2-polyprenyl-3-methyl-5-hydroxy-6-metoxy-1,4-benzoquinol methylase
MLAVDTKYDDLNRFLAAQLAVSPGHERFFKRRFPAAGEAELAAVDDLAGHLGKLVGDRLEEFAADYAWLCEEQIAEEMHFRREGRYRLGSFEEAYREVYSNAPYMKRYMNGLLMTQLWWSNHTEVIRFYRERFLATNKPGYTHLEIGPGHGLFLYFAAADDKAGSVSAWDISEASIAATREALLKLGARRMPELALVDLFKGPTGFFDSVVFSEVLEHMEKPGEALDVIRSVMAPDGRLFLNMPINSPAPDHLFNAESPEELEAFVASRGYRILDRAFFPATNQTLEAARKKKLTINCVFVAGRG